MKKIGLYGGTFDPIHCAHLILARDAAEQLLLDEVIFVPAAVSPHKLDEAQTPAAIRLEMLQAALAGERRFTVHEAELHRPPPSYTIDTVEQFRRAHPDDQVFYLVGSDHLPRLHTWHRFSDLQELVQFVVLERGNAHPHPGEYRTIQRQIGISATEIRNRVASGQSIRYLVPEAVAAIIERHQLYQEPNRSPQKN
ncbi:nicotinate-nucleotide adenylyltransferase [soil metagenome]